MDFVSSYLFWLFYISHPTSLLLFFLNSSCCFRFYSVVPISVHTVYQLWFMYIAWRLKIGHVRCINIQAWLRGFRVKIANFSSFLCPSIPKRDLDTKKTTPNVEVWPESLKAMLEYWYIERGLLYAFLVSEFSYIIFVHVRTTYWKTMPAYMMQDTEVSIMAKKHNLIYRHC